MKTDEILKLDDRSPENYVVIKKVLRKIFELESANEITFINNISKGTLISMIRKNCKIARFNIVIPLYIYDSNEEQKNCTAYVYIKGEKVKTIEAYSISVLLRKCVIYTHVEARKANKG